MQGAAGGCRCCPRLQLRSRSQHRFLSSRPCGQRPDPNLLLAPTPAPRCQPRRRVPALPQEALSAPALVLQLGRLRAHRLLRAAVHPGEGRVPALGRLERQQRLPHRAPDVLPPRLLRCECPVPSHQSALGNSTSPRQRGQGGRAQLCRGRCGWQGLLAVGSALPPAGFAPSLLFSTTLKGTSVCDQSWGQPARDGGCGTAVTDTSQAKPCPGPGPPCQAPPSSGLWERSPGSEHLPLQESPRATRREGRCPAVPSRPHPPRGAAPPPPHPPLSPARITRNPRSLSSRRRTSSAASGRSATTTPRCRPWAGPTTKWAP